MGDILLLILFIIIVFGVGYEMYYTYKLFPAELKNRGVQMEKQEGSSGIWNVLAFPILFIAILLPFFSKDYNHWFRCNRFGRNTW